MTRFFFVSLFMFGFISLSNAQIFLIRHAEVNLNKPLFSSYKSVIEHKKMYNISSVKSFDKDIVLNKIDKNLDTVFCSPQFRALSTSKILFGDSVYLLIDSAIQELDYAVLKIPFIVMPTDFWSFFSRIAWRYNIYNGNVLSFDKRIIDLKNFEKKLTAHYQRNGKSVVIAHGMLNRELKKMLKQNGFKICPKTRYRNANLWVNCLEKK